jgi:hypothetical protein
MKKVFFDAGEIAGFEIEDRPRCTLIQLRMAASPHTAWTIPRVKVTVHLDQGKVHVNLTKAHLQYRFVAFVPSNRTTTIAVPLSFVKTPCDH